MHWKRLKPFFAPAFRPHVDRTDAVTVPVVGVRQARNYSCGYASTMMILRSFHSAESHGEACGEGLPGTGKELFEALGTTRSGTRQNAIVRELRRRNISANVRYDFDFDALVRTIDAGKLVIGYLVDAEHWLVLFGYERGHENSANRVYVADPRPGEEVEHLWAEYGERLGNFGIVCSPRAPRRIANRPNASVRPAAAGVHRRPARAASGRKPSVPSGMLPPREQLILPHCE